MSLIVRGARILGGDAADLTITDGAISAVGTASAGANDTVVDADGLIALPGLVDLHTHLREPGFEQSETVATGVRAAAAGGFTAVFAMANTNPVADTVAVVEQVAELGRRARLATVQPIGAVTVGLRGERLADLGMMARSAARVRVFSDDGHCVHDAQLMRRALEYVAPFGGVIAQHAQEPRLTDGAQMHESALAGELGLTGWPSVAESTIVARDVQLAELTGARLHVCHVSSAETVEVLRWAKGRGIAVTAEVTPHHLLLTQDRVRGYDAAFKVNPPLREDEDVAAVRQALADGTIDIVATDHAPHPREAKATAWAEAAMGMVGLESALSVVQSAMVQSGLLDWSDVARVMSTVPAEIGSLAGYDRPLQVGAAAHITLIDPSTDTSFDVDRLHGRSTNSPFLGETLPGRVVHTIHAGRISLLDGEVQ